MAAQCFFVLQPAAIAHVASEGIDHLLQDAAFLPFVVAAEEGDVGGVVGRDVGPGEGVADVEEDAIEHLARILRRRPYPSTGSGTGWVGVS